MNDDITPYIPKEDYENGLDVKYSNTVIYIKFGYINTLGEWIIKPKFLIPVKILEVTPNTVFDFKDGVALMYDEQSEMFGYINVNGDWIEPPKYENLKDLLS